MTEIFSFLVGVLKAAAWPGTVILLGMKFRTEIHGLFGALANVIERGGWKYNAKEGFVTPLHGQPTAGTEQEAGLPSVSHISEGLDLAPSPSADFRSRYAPPYSELVTEIDEKISKEIAILATQGFTQLEAYRYKAIDAAAATTLERASRYIFGSQIDLLKWLANSQTGTLSIGEVKPVYEYAVVAAPSALNGITFEQWLEFLQRWELVTLVDGRVSITNLGRSLEPYMSAMGYLVLRPIG